MAECDICAILKNKEEFRFIYEDEKCFALLHESPAVLGHTLVIPKQHAAILEELEEEIVEHLFVVCNKMSTLLFERLKVHGTNIILNNAHAAGQELNHVTISVLPRKENDKLDLEWEPKKATEQELKAVALIIKSASDIVFAAKGSSHSTKTAEHNSHETEYHNEEEKIEENYMAKAFRRTP